MDESYGRYEKMFETNVVQFLGGRIIPIFIFSYDDLGKHGGI